MTQAQIQNIIWYVAIAVAAAVLATGIQLGTVLSGADPVLIRPLLATFTVTLFGTLATAAGASFRPRVDRSDISHLVSQVGPQQAKAALEVEAIKQTTGQRDAITPDQIQQLVAALVVPLADELHGDVVTALEQRLRETPAGQERG